MPLFDPTALAGRAAIVTGGGSGIGRSVALLLAANGAKVASSFLFSAACSFSISPTAAADDTGSVSEAVARAVRVVRESGLPHETTSMFTTIEGEWDEVMGVIKACVDRLAESAPRVSLVVKCDIRPGRTGQLTAKLERVEQHLRDTAR